MRLALRNLGRLQEATIDLDRDLILLTGPNNTSKTYVAHAIYGFCERFDLVSSFFVAGALRGRFEGQQEVPTIDLMAFVDEHLAQMAEVLASEYRGKLADVFSAGTDFFARSEIGVELDAEQRARARQGLLDARIEEQRETGLGVAVVRKAAGEATLVLELRRTPPGADAREAALDFRFWAGGVLAGVLSDAFFRLPVATYILTAERAAIQLFSHELSSNRSDLVDTLLKMSSDAGSRPEIATELVKTLQRGARRYPQAIRDSLAIVNDAAALKKNTSPFAYLADWLDRELLGGAVRVEDDGEMVFRPDPSVAGLAMHLASSSVKSLAGLSFYLRHLAQKGQLLIVDEPELNLHPDNQRRVARLLARLSRAGVRVLVSTHSDYVVREINNLIMLGADQDGRLRQRLGYDEEEILEPARVGAHLFDATRARAIEVKPTGIEVETIDREINALNSVSQEIYFSLFDKPDR